MGFQLVMAVWLGLYRLKTRVEATDLSGLLCEESCTS